MTNPTLHSKIPTSIPWKNVIYSDDNYFGMIDFDDVYYNEIEDDYVLTWGDYVGCADDIFTNRWVPGNYVDDDV